MAEKKSVCWRKDIPEEEGRIAEGKSICRGGKTVAAGGRTVAEERQFLEEGTVPEKEKDIAQIGKR